MSGPDAPLSATQQWALGWLASNPPAKRSVWRAAGIGATTMRSLIDRGFVEWLLYGHPAPSAGTTVWHCTELGRAAALAYGAALAKATNQGAAHG